jgi:hypothetical protein
MKIIFQSKNLLKIIPAARQYCGSGIGGKVP